MSPALKIVISASRRTDIPAFYMEDFMRQIRRGFFETINPFNQRTSAVPAGPRDVHAIVFWSKNFGPFLDKEYGDILRAMGYHLFFNFTINSESRLLEPGVPRLSERLLQLGRLCAKFDPRCVLWRFDPICHYRVKENRLEDNLGDFQIIAETAEQCGVKRCITSFMDHYPKIKNRTKKLPGFSFADISMDLKVKQIVKMEKFLRLLNIQLALCCETEVLQSLPETAKVAPGSCIPNDLLMELFGGCLSMKKDAGQRVKQGCGCKTSVDIGNYHTQPCRHNCLFCYATPTSNGSNCLQPS
jgi:hypothetical protein